MGRFVCSVTIQRSIEEVFAVLTDPTRSPEWSKHSIRGELLTEGPPRVGSRRRTVVKGFGGIGTMEPQSAHGVRADHRREERERGLRNLGP